MEASAVLHAPTALTLAKKPPVPIELEAGWAAELFWTLWNREKSLLLPGIKPRPPSPYAVAIPSYSASYSLLACSKIKFSEHCLTWSETNFITSFEQFWRWEREMLILCLVSSFNAQNAKNSP
jgi:hypothetical protein